jgi:predicted enzyme related to lactoylglutathione lyase
MTEALGSLRYVIIDASDTEAEAAFWGTVLGVEVTDRFGDGYVILAPSHEGASKLTFQPVPEKKVVKNRLHLDLSVPDIEAATVDLEKLGASVASDILEMEGYRWRVMRDPEGNEFCIADVDA